MAFSFKKFLAGIKLVPKTTSTADSKGDLEVIDSTGKLGFHNGTTVSPVITESHSAALTNKTIDADSNTITNIENADIKAAAAIDASKIADGSVSNTEFQYISTVTSNVQDQLDSKALATGLSDHINDTVDAHDASAISVSAISGLTATEVQAALAEHQVEIENVVSDLGAHIIDTVDAHDASAISNIPSGNLAATDIQGAVNELQSDIDTRALNSDLTTHTSASTGVHGVVGSVVGTSDTQTLTNKTITGADIRTPVRSDVKQDTKANLVTYALTATNGQTVFATDTKEMFQIVDGLLESIGGGAGIGGVDILFSQTFEEAAITDFTQTGMSLSTSSPIHGAISALMTHDSVANRSFKQVVAVDEKFRGQAMLLELNVKSTASAGNVTLNVYDETNAANIVASEQLTLSSATGGIKDFVAFTIPATCLSLSYTITALPEAGSPVTRIDDILCQLNNASLLETSVTVPNITAWQGYTPTFTGFGTATNIEFEWRQVGENVEIRGKFTTGTPTSVEARVSLPNAYTSSSSSLIASLASNGTYFRGVSTSSHGGSVLMEPSVAYITLGPATTFNSVTSIALSKALGTDIAGVSDIISLTASIPILGLTATSDVAIPLTQSGIVQEADSELYAAGNAGQVITAGVTKIPFIVVSMKGSAITWSGDTATINESGIYEITGNTSFTTAADQRIVIVPSGGGQARISTLGSTLANRIFAHTRHFNAGDTFYLISETAGGTLSNSSTLHTIRICKQGSLKQVTVNTNSKITIPTSELRFEGASSRGAVATAIVKFDTMAKIRGDAFTVTNTTNDGTYITMTKAGKLDLSVNLISTNDVYISRNQLVLTTIPTQSEVLARETPTASTGGCASWSGFVAVGDVLRVCAAAIPTSSFVNSLNLAFQEQDIQVSVSNTLPQFSDSDSSVRVDTANGFGSTNTLVRRFSNLNQNLGTDVAYADSSTLGASFTVMESGIYSISYTDSSTTASASIGIVKNQTSLTDTSDDLARERHSATAGEELMNASWSGYLVVGDIIRPIATTAAFSNARVGFTMSKVGKPNVTGVDVTPFIITQFDKGSIGEIKAFAGNVDGVSYLECDGRAVSRGTYSALFAAIGITHGQGDGSLTFNIPDYRGRFLRGTSGAATLDPDKLTRTAMNTGGNAGNLVGSVQADEYASHAHNIRWTTSAGTTGRIGSSIQGTAATTFNGVNQAEATGGGAETRPENAYVNYGIRFKAANEAILTETDTFSTDTAALTYAGSGTYTLSTLANAPVGTFITYTYAASTNTRTQTTVAPTQTTADMNANGMLIYTRAFNVASTAALPSVFAIQIGKGLKGKSLDLYKSAGKVNSGSLDMYGAETTTYTLGVHLNTYNESTGVLVVDAGYRYANAAVNCFLLYADGTVQTSGYLVINASKNPALTGLGLNRIAARGVNTAGTSVATTGTVIPWNTVKTFDTHGALNAATGVFTAPETAYYQVSVGLVYALDTYAVNQSVYITIEKNGVEIGVAAARAQTASSISLPVYFSDVVLLAKDQTLAVRGYATSGPTALQTGGNDNFFSITKVSV